MKLLIVVVLVALVATVLSVPLSRVPLEKQPGVLLPPLPSSRNPRETLEKGAQGEELEGAESAYGLWPYAWPYSYPYVYKWPYVVVY